MYMRFLIHMTETPMLATLNFLCHCLLNDMSNPLEKAKSILCKSFLYFFWQSVSETLVKKKDMIYSALPLEQREDMQSAEKKSKLYVL